MEKSAKGKDNLEERQKELKEIKEMIDKISFGKFPVGLRAKFKNFLRQHYNQNG